MKFARLFGITLPMVVVSCPKCSSLIKILGNTNDNDRVEDFNSEIDIFLSFFDSIDKVFVNREDKKKANQYKRSIGDTSKRFLTSKEIELAGISQDAPITLSRIVKDFDGNEISLSGDRELEYEIICGLYNKIDFVKNLKDGLKFNKFFVDEAFGTKLYNWRDGNYLEFIISHKLKTKNDENQIKDSLVHLNKMGDYYFKFLEDKLSTTEGRKLDINDVARIINDKEFVNIITKGSLYHHLSSVNIEKLYHIWKDLKSVSKETFELTLKINGNYSEDQYKTAFKNLDLLGLVGLNFCSAELFESEILDIFGFESKYASFSNDLIVNRDVSKSFISCLNLMSSGSPVEIEKAVI